MMTSAPAGATDLNTYRISNSTPCCWRSSRYSSRNVRVRRCSSWFANVTPESNPLRLTHNECSVTFHQGAHNTTHESMQIAMPRRSNDRRMILGSKNPMVMQPEMGRWQGWDFPPPLPGRITGRIEFRWFASPANFLMDPPGLNSTCSPTENSEEPSIWRNAVGAEALAFACHRI